MAISQANIKRLFVLHFLAVLTGLDSPPLAGGFFSRTLARIASAVHSEFPAMATVFSAAHYRHIIHLSV